MGVYTLHFLLSGYLKQIYSLGLFSLFPGDISFMGWSTKLLCPARKVYNAGGNGDRILLLFLMGAPSYTLGVPIL